MKFKNDQDIDSEIYFADYMLYIFNKQQFKLRRVDVTSSTTFTSGTLLI